MTNSQLGMTLFEDKTWESNVSFVVKDKKFRVVRYSESKCLNQHI